MLLPSGTSLGRLHLLEVYDVYDGPRIFSARSAAGTTFVAFWSYEREDGDEWLYVPVTPARLDAIVEGAISLRSAFLEPEDGVVFRVSFHGREAQAVAVAPHSIEDQFLPAEGDVLAGERRTSHAPTLETDTLLHGRIRQEVILERTDKKGPISWEAVSRVLSCWREMFLNAIAELGGSGDVFPLGASPGSFKIVLTAPDTDETEDAFESIQRLVSSLPLSGNPADAAQLQSYDALLSALLDHKLKLVVRQSVELGRPPLEVTFDLPTPHLVAAVHGAAVSFLDSRSIPQADRLDRVIRLVELVSQGQEVTAESLDVVHRQVNYYKQASRILRLLDADNRITPAGQQLVALSKIEAQLAVLVVQFETSLCGWRWIEWSQGRSLLDVKAATATEFLSRVAPTLSTSTMSRRSRTLEAWRAELTKAHYLLRLGTELG